MGKISRYFQIWFIWLKYFFLILGGTLGIRGTLPLGFERPRTPQEHLRLRAHFLREALQELGPTFIKIGQFMSMRSGTLPQEFATEMEKLQDHAPPFPFSQVRQTVEAELGSSLEELFVRFKEKPWASASLSQVHLATTAQGEMVAVKVQRPNITVLIHRDIAVLRAVARVLSRYSQFFRMFDLDKVVSDFEHSVIDELDFRLEASNIAIIAQSLKSFDRIKLPKVFPDYSGVKVLTMERIIGYKVSDEARKHLSQKERTEIAQQLLEAYLKQIMEYGFFHADPHPGNIILIPKEKKVALVDLGIVGRLDSGLRDRLVKSFLAFSEQDSERIMELVIESSTYESDADLDGFAQDLAGVVTRYHNRPREQTQVGQWVIDVSRIAAAHRIHPPAAMAVLGKTMIYVDQVSRLLDPTLSYLTFVEQSRQKILIAQLKKALNPSNVTRSALDLGNLLLDMPEKFHLLVKKLVDNDFRIQFEHVRLEGFISAVSQAANRLAIAAILAAIIIGTGMATGGNEIERLLSSYRYFIVTGFFFAIFLGMYLIYSIWRSGRR